MDELLVGPECFSKQESERIGTIVSRRSDTTIACGATWATTAFVVPVSAGSSRPSWRTARAWAARAGARTTTRFVVAFLQDERQHEN